MEDTDQEVDALRLKLLRAMTPARRLQLAADWSAALRTLCQAGVRAQFPGASEAELHRRFAERWLGEDLAGKVYLRPGKADG
jgi:hypothetical protein